MALLKSDREDYHLTLDLAERSQCIILVGSKALDRKVTHLSKAPTVTGRQNTETYPPSDVSSSSRRTIDVRYSICLVCTVASGHAAGGGEP